jgi:hypothetical protein
MLRLSLLALMVAALVAQSGCSPAPEREHERKVTIPALDFEASYQLRFNDSLVGHALFTLHTDPHTGSYRIEAFSVPAGKMAQADDHEVLESSTGTIEQGIVRPARFAFSVMEEGAIKALDIEFDWQRQLLHLRDDTRSRELPLLPNTQDRLSYLLLARQLALGGEVTRHIQIVTPLETEDTSLELGAADQIEVPAGVFDAVVVRRLAPAPGDQRRLWLNDSVCALPLRIEHPAGDNLVEMVLEQCTQTAATVGEPAAG